MKAATAFLTSPVTSIFASVSETEPDQKPILSTLHVNVWKKVTLVMCSRNEGSTVTRFIASESKPVGRKSWCIPSNKQTQATYTGKLTTENVSHCILDITRVVGKISFKWILGFTTFNEKAGISQQTFYHVVFL